MVRRAQKRPVVRGVDGRNHSTDVTRVSQKAKLRGRAAEDPLGKEESSVDLPVYKKQVGKEKVEERVRRNDEMRREGENDICLRGSQQTSDGTK